MSDERIDIEVSDKVDASVEKKLRSIASQAREGHTAVERLKAALSDINSAPVQRLADASAKLTNALARELSAQARLTNATTAATAADAKAEIAKARLAAESAKAATAEQRLATEVAKTQTALSRSAAAQSAAATAALRAENASRRAAAAQSENARAASELEGRISRLKGSVDPTAASIDRMNAELTEASNLYRMGAISASEFAKAESVLNDRIRQTTLSQAALNNMQAKGVGSSKAMTQAGLNLSRQFADIGVTAAMGMNPLMILIQQGPQVADAFAMAKAQGLGFNAVLKGLWASLAPFLPILLAISAVVGTVAAGFGLLHRELSKGYPKDITEGMNLTEEQLDRVKSKTVTFGDTVMATFTVIGRHIMKGPVGDALRWLGNFFSDVADWIGKTWVNLTALQVGLMVGAYKTITQNWRQFPRVFGDFVVSGVNAAIGAIEALINKASEGLNFLIRAYNANPMNVIKLPEIGRAELARVNNQFAGAGAQLGQSFAENVATETANARRGLSALGDEIEAEALRRARARATEEAGDPNKGPKGRTGREEWDRAAALVNVNRELDNELARMGMLKDAREVQNRLDQVSQQFAERNVPLNEAETAALREKITAIQAGVRVQAEMDRINEAANGPALKYNTTLQAAAQLLERGVITQAAYSAEVAKATREYAHASDALIEHNESLDDQIALLGLYGPALERASYLRQVENTLLAQGKTLYDASTGALTAEAQALVAKFDQLQRGLLLQQELNAIYQDVTANDVFISNLDAMYAEIERMRQADVLSEGQAAQARAKLNAKYNEIRLQNASTFFGDLASLSSAGNSKLAAIGRAAAIAQATIDGYLAVQKALAAAPPPVNYAMAAAAAVKAAVNVAGIASTHVGNFNEGGSFMVGGQPGVDKNLVSMGLSRGERVTVETKSQQRQAGAVVNVNIKNASGTVERRENADGSVDIDVLIDAVEQGIAGRTAQGGSNLNTALEGRYGLNPAKGNR